MQVVSTYPVQVGVRVFRHVVVEDNVHSLNVHASSKQVGGDQDALLEVLELLVATQSETSPLCLKGGQRWI